MTEQIVQPEVCVTPAVHRVALELLADRAPNWEIADRLGITEDTVKSHMKVLLKQTGSMNRTEAVVKVLRGRVRLIRGRTTSTTPSP